MYWPSRFLGTEAGHTDLHKFFACVKSTDTDETTGLYRFVTSKFLAQSTTALSMARVVAREEQV